MGLLDDVMLSASGRYREPMVVEEQLKDGEEQEEGVVEVMQRQKMRSGYSLSESASSPSTIQDYEE